MAGFFLPTTPNEAPCNTGRGRSVETGLEYFGARYYSAAQGRSPSPDPLLNSGRPWDGDSGRSRSAFRSEANQHSAVNPISIPDGIRSLFRPETDHFSGAFRNRDRFDKECRSRRESAAALDNNTGK